MNKTNLFTPDRATNPPIQNDLFGECCDCETELVLRHSHTITHEDEEIHICDKCMQDYIGMDDIDIEDYRIDLAEGKEGFYAKLNEKK